MPSMERARRTMRRADVFIMSFIAQTLENTSKKHPVKPPTGMEHGSNLKKQEESDVFLNVSLIRLYPLNPPFPCSIAVAFSCFVPACPGQVLHHHPPVLQGNRPVGIPAVVR